MYFTPTQWYPWNNHGQFTIIRKSSTYKTQINGKFYRRKCIKKKEMAKSQ